MNQEIKLKEFELIDDILSMQDNIIKMLLYNILNEYPINTQTLIEKAKDYLTAITEDEWTTFMIDGTCNNSRNKYGVENQNKNYFLYFKNKENYENKELLPYQIKYTDLTKWDFDVVYNNFITDEKSTILIKNALYHCFKEIMSEYLDDILNKYRDKLKEYKNYVEKTIESKQTFSEEKMLLIEDINTQLELLKKKREMYQYFDEDFNFHNNNFFKQQKKIKSKRLPSINKVRKDINTFNKRNIITEKTFDEELHLDYDDEGKPGWNWYIKCDISEKSFQSYAEKIIFIEASETLKEIIKEINDIFPSITITYKNDPSYPNKTYNRKNYDESLEYGFFESIQGGILSIKINNKEIDKNELLQRLNNISSLIEIRFHEIHQYPIDYKERSLLLEMKDKLLKNSYLYPLLNPDIEYVKDEFLEDESNWEIYSNYIDENEYELYEIILELIKTIITIITDSENNHKKAIFTKKFSDYYDEIFTKYTLKRQINNSIQELNEKKKLLETENQEIIDSIERYQKLLSDINSELENLNNKIFIKNN